MTPTALDPPDDELDAELFPDVPQAARTSDPAPSTAIAAVALLSHRLHGLANICMTAPWRSFPAPCWTTMSEMSERPRRDRQHNRSSPSPDAPIARAASRCVVRSGALLTQRRGAERLWRLPGTMAGDNVGLRRGAAWRANACRGRPRGRRGRRGSGFSVLRSVGVLCAVLATGDTEKAVGQENRDRRRDDPPCRSAGAAGLRRISVSSCGCPRVWPASSGPSPVDRALDEREATASGGRSALLRSPSWQDSRAWNVCSASVGTSCGPPTRRP